MDAGRLIANAKLHDIRIVQCSAKSSRLPENLEKGPKLFVTYATRVPIGKVDQSLPIRAELSLKVADDEQDQEPYLEVSATYLLEYAFPAGLNPKKGEIKAFAETNVRYNSWPYFREFVQSMAGRAGLPPVILPLYRAPRARVADGPAKEVSKTPPGGLASSDP